MLNSRGVTFQSFALKFQVQTWIALAAYYTMPRELGSRHNCRCSYPLRFGWEGLVTLLSKKNHNGNDGLFDFFFFVGGGVVSVAGNSAQPLRHINKLPFR